MSVIGILQQLSFPTPSSERARPLLAHAIDPAMFVAGISVNRLARYWKYAVFGTLVPGVTLFILAAPNIVWKEDPNPFWKMLAGLAGILCAVGVLLWLCRAIATVGSDVIKLWKESKAGAVLTFAAIAFLAYVLHRFTGSHFYGWYVDSWFFFFMALLFGSYVLLRIAVALTVARKN